MKEGILEFLNMCVDVSFFLPWWSNYHDLFVFIFGCFNVGILVVTLLYLRRYTKTAEAMTQKMSEQVAFDQMPMLMLYVRDALDYAKYPYCLVEKRKAINKFRIFLIESNPSMERPCYFFRLRNTGKGVAFNIRVKIIDTKCKFKIKEYASRFFAPLNDEHSIKIVKENGEGICNSEDLNEAIFLICCEDMVGTKYQFKYTIADIKKKHVRYIEHKVDKKFEVK